MVEAIRKLFMLKPRERHLGKCIDDGHGRRMAEVFERVLKLRVPGFLQVKAVGDRIVLKMSPPLPGYDNGISYMWFAGNDPMHVRPARSDERQLSKIFEACLGACQYSDIVASMPPQLRVFYGNDDITVFKKGETFESLAVIADLDGKPA